MTDEQWELIRPLIERERRVVERAFAMLGRARRLAKDYEVEDLYSEAMIHLASIASLLRRVAPSPASATRYHITSHAA